MTEPVDPRIDAALRRADEVADDQPERHVSVYEDVHETLQRVLSEVGGPPAESTEAPASTQPHGGAST